MSKPFSSAVRRAMFALLLAAAAGLENPLPAVAAKPYTETAPKRGFQLFNRPKKKTPEAQWEYVQGLDRRNKLRAATRQSLALRLFWPHSAEAPAAQLLYARLLERRGKIQYAFDAYQHLADNYPGHFEFNEVMASQMNLARTLMERRKGRFLFFPGFTAPERAIPLFEQIVENAPEGAGAAEAYYRIGLANERIYEYALAIDAYFNTLNRFPDSSYAEEAARGQVRCHLSLADESPQDTRALETAVGSCDLFLQRFPDAAQGAEVRADRARVQAQLAQHAFARARYYDRILHNPESAIIEYRSFVARFPDAAQAPVAQRRIETLAQKRNP